MWLHFGRFDVRAADQRDHSAATWDPAKHRGERSPASPGSRSTQVGLHR